MANELYGFKKNLEKVQVRSKSESAAKSHLVPTLITNTPLAAPNTQNEYASRTISELANWNVVVLCCKCQNVTQNIVYFRGVNIHNYLVDTLTSTKTRGEYYVDWTNNRIKVAWLECNPLVGGLFVQIMGVYGLVQNVDVVDIDTEDEPSGDDGEDIDIGGLTEEVQGIRIGADGTIYETAGQAVREQYIALAQKLDVLDVTKTAQEMTELINGVNAAVDTAIQQIEEAGGLILDPTLTQSGQAADAKVVGDKFDILKITETLTGNYSAGSYILLNVSYGTVIDTTPVSNSAFAYIIIPCKKGDKFVITGTGATAPRLWGFTDSEYKLLSVEGANMARENYERIADQDGYFISNITIARTYSLTYTHLFDKTSYTNLYAYVDEEIQNVETNIGQVNTSLINTENIVSSIVDIGAVFDINGYINGNGTVSTHNDYKCTDYVQVVSNGSFVPVEYKLRVFVNTKIGLYDANHELISVISPSSSASLEEVVGTLYYVDGLVYARFCTAVTNGYDDYYVRMSTVKNQIIGMSDNSFCNYDGNEISMFRKGLCIGDSLTQGTLNYYQDGGTGHYTSVEGVNYPTYLEKLTGLEITNMGNAGYTSVDWWNIHQNDDLSGYDFAIIQLGVNDLGHYGGWTTTTETAFTNIINKLKTQNKKIKIFVANIIPAISYSSEGYLAMSASISDFVTNLDDEQVILLDMQAHGHTRDSEAYNCGHLSAYGYWRLAQDYKNYIGYYINTHKAQFREVQFIGSDYYYTPV